MYHNNIIGVSISLDKMWERTSCGEKLVNNIIIYNTIFSKITAVVTFLRRKRYHGEKNNNYSNYDDETERLASIVDVLSNYQKEEHTTKHRTYHIHETHIRCIYTIYGYKWSIILLSKSIVPVRVTCFFR